ncbi:MAG: KGK domain-containing protein [Synechococcales bacterium]|nr:KGK domain-containing protein [Synechococcales bacterium]
MSQQGNLSLSMKDVIHIEGFPGAASLFQDNATLRIKDVLSKLEMLLGQSGLLSADEIHALMQQGIPCDMLQPGAGDWQSGKIRLSLDFHPSTTAPGTATSVNLAAMAAPAMVEKPQAAPMPAADGMMANEMAPLEDVFGDETDSADLDADMDLDLAGMNVPEMEMPAMDAVEADASADLDFGDDMVMLMGEPASASSSEADDFSELLEDTMLSTDSSQAVAIDLADVDFMSVGEEATELELDLDSQMVTPEAAENMDSPWDLNGDLDDMLMANGHHL